MRCLKSYMNVTVSEVWTPGPWILSVTQCCLSLSSMLWAVLSSGKQVLGNLLSGKSSIMVLDKCIIPLFQGSYLTAGASKEDYSISIGNGECTDIHLTDNELLCLPPGKEPDTNATAVGAHHIEGAPRVTVRWWDLYSQTRCDVKMLKHTKCNDVECLIA